MENFTPRVMEQFGFDWDRVHALNDRAHHGPDACLRSRRPVAGSNGVRPDDGMSDRHVLVDGIRRRPPGAGEGGLRPAWPACTRSIATMLALIERDRRGGGRLVEAAMVESVLNAAAEQVVEYCSSGTLLGRDGNRGP